MKKRVIKISGISLCKISRIFIILSTVLLIPIKLIGQDNQYWSDKFVAQGAVGVNILNAAVYSSAVDGNDFYIGGNFSAVNGVAASGIAHWDGSKWNNLGEEMSFGGSSTNVIVYSILVDGNKVYVGGRFSHVGNLEVNGLAVWDTQNKTWSAFTESGIAGTDGIVQSVIKIGSTLYAAGTFTQAGITGANNIARWDGSEWHALSTGTNGIINQIEVIDNKIYAVGSFNEAGGTPANRMAVWDGTSWSQFGGGANSTVLTIKKIDDNIYVGGQFSTLGVTAANYIGYWDGSTWNSFPTQPNAQVQVIKESSDGILIGGFFTQVGISEASGLARWNGSSWEVADQEFIPHLAGVSGVLTISEYGSNHFVGGAFSGFDGKTLSNMATLNSAFEITAFTPLSNAGGIGGILVALAADGADIYAGGTFSTAGNIVTRNIAKWNGSTWESLGDGIPAGQIAVILPDGDKVYVGGAFTKSSGAPGDNLAVYNKNTKTWSEVGEGVNGTVNSIIKAGSRIYVGGNFTQAGSIPVGRIASWDGSSWSALGGGFTGNVTALAVMGGTVIAGGSFNDGTLHRIAAWDGTSWNPLGGGVDNGSVSALQVVGDTLLYAGGSFTDVDGGTSVKMIASWDGTDWKPVGLGLDGIVMRLAYQRNTLFAAGYFRNSGITALENVAAWNGSQWKPLGSGLGIQPNAVAAALAANSDDYLFVGGLFTTSGDKIATNIARYNFGADPAVSVEPRAEIVTRFMLEQNYPNPFNPTTSISYSVPEQSMVSLKVFDMLGREVATLVDGYKTVGAYTINFDASNLASGIYIYRLKAKGTTVTKKMVLAK